MQVKKLISMLIFIAAAVTIFTYTAINFLPVTAAPAATILPRKTEQQPQFLFSFGNTDKGRLKQPIALAVDDQGKIYVTDAGDFNVKVYSPNGRYVRSFGSKGTGRKDFGYPYGVVVLSNGDIVIADSINLNVRVFAKDGAYKKTILDAKEKIKPGSLSLDSSGRIYVSDLLNHQIIVIDSEGKIVRTVKPAVSSLKYPQEVVLGQSSGEIWVADSGNFAVKKIDDKGLVDKTILGFGSPQQAFSLIRGIGVDNLNRLLIADTQQGTIHVMKPDGREVFSFDGQGTPAGNLVYPSFILVDKSGRIYIADRGTAQVRVWGYSEN